MQWRLIIFFFFLRHKLILCNTERRHPSSSKSQHITAATPRLALDRDCCGRKRIKQNWIGVEVAKVGNWHCRSSQNSTSDHHLLLLLHVSLVSWQRKRERKDFWKKISNYKGFMIDPRPLATVRFGSISFWYCLETDMIPKVVLAS